MPEPEPDWAEDARYPALDASTAGGWKRMPAFDPVKRTLVTAILVAVIVSEQIAGARRRARGEPSPLERLEAG